MTLLAAALLAPSRGGAQVFGPQVFADAASAALQTSIQQSITAVPLPPASGQSFLWQFDSELGAFAPSEQLGPTVLRSTQTIGPGRWSIRAAASYFELSDQFEGTYKIDSLDPDNPFGTLYTRLGYSASANVTLLNFALTYGFTDRIEATLNVPVSVVQSQAFEQFLAVKDTFPPVSTAEIGAVPGSPQKIDPAIERGSLIEASASFNALGADFNSGTHAGVGRISVGAKGLLWAGDISSVAFAPEFYCNSPSSDEFAGSNSPSILPRLIGQVRAAKRLTLHADVGYDYDFDVAELRRFVWNTGVSVPIVNATFDVGVGGSLFDQSVQALPLSIVTQQSQTTLLDPDATELGTNFVDFLFGMKMRLIGGAVLSGSAGVPVTEDGFRPAAVGSVALEYYF